jgi:hypothetical protein
MIRMVTQNMSAPSPAASLAVPSSTAPCLRVDSGQGEAGNIGKLVSEVVTALRPECAFEIVLVDDGSDDGTGDEFVQSCRDLGAAGQLVRHQASVGQSTACPPPPGMPGAYLSSMAMAERSGRHPGPAEPGARPEPGGEHFCIAGFRHKRKTPSGRRSSRRSPTPCVARSDDGVLPTTAVRDSARHPAAAALRPHALPYSALVRRLGGRIAVVPATATARPGCQYTAWNRVWVGIVDMVGVRWLIQRSKQPVLERVDVIGERR